MEQRMKQWSGFLLRTRRGTSTGVCAGAEVASTGRGKSGLRFPGAVNRARIPAWPLPTGIIGGADLVRLGPTCTFYSLPAVFEELRDSRAKRFLEAFPFPIKFRPIPPEASRAVVAFARKTGDYHQLSKTDLQCIALTYALEAEHFGTQHLRTEPRVFGGVPLSSVQSRVAIAAPGVPLALDPLPQTCLDHLMFLPSRTIDIQLHKARAAWAPPAPQQATAASRAGVTRQEEDKKLKDDSKTTLNTEEKADTDRERSVESKEAEIGNRGSSWGGEWITPQNMHLFDKPISSTSHHLEQERKRVDSTVACVTTDFGMQNVLLQLGLRVYSVNGLEIKTIRNWLMQCHVCRWQTRDMSTKFCGECGGHTMIRVAVTIDDNGIVRHRPQTRKIFNLRGTQFPIPKPKGGRMNKDLVFREGGLKQNKKFAWKVKEEDFETSIEFGYSKVGQSKKYEKPDQVGYGSRNSNAVRPVSQKNKRNRRRRDASTYEACFLILAVAHALQVHFTTPPFVLWSQSILF
eukprot:g37056.t1